MTTQQQLLSRITDYLSAGGLVNPELMPHEKVRDLIMDCRGYIEEAACITRIGRDGQDRPFVVYLSNGTKITVGRNRGRCWLQIEDQARIRTALSSSVEVAQTLGSQPGRLKAPGGTEEESQ